jgi:hydrogenase maturation protease
MSDATEGSTLVIGCGNLLGADDGVGLTALEHLRAWDLPPDVELADGGTWGLNLLPLIEGATRVLLLDAVKTGADPGSLTTLERDQIPRFLSTKVSPHQIDLREVLALAEFRGTLPQETVVIGIEPERIEMSADLSPAVAERVDDLVLAAVERLRTWGHRVPLPVEVGACTS